MGSQTRVLKVASLDALGWMICKETKGNHRWIHDGLLFALPGEEEPEYPWFWKCLYCEMRIRTPFKLEKVEFEGNVLEQINDAIEQGERP
jgi:hypothetical protein